MEFMGQIVCETFQVNTSMLFIRFSANILVTVWTSIARPIGS